MPRAEQDSVVAYAAEEAASMARLVREGIVRVEEEALWRLGVVNYYDMHDPTRFHPSAVLTAEQESLWRLGADMAFQLWACSIGMAPEAPYERRFRLDLVENKMVPRVLEHQTEGGPIFEQWTPEPLWSHVRLVGNAAENILNDVAQAWEAQALVTSRSNQRRFGGKWFDQVSLGTLEAAVAVAGKGLKDAYL